MFWKGDGLIFTGLMSKIWTRSVKYFCQLTVLAAVGLLCAGCFPQRITDSPAACGVVLDAQTHDPVQGAKVVVAYSARPGWPDLTTPTLVQALTNSRPPLVLTGQYGQFNIPRERILVINSEMSDWNAYGTLVIWHDGYQPALIPVSDTNNVDVVAKTFYLTPESQK